MNNKKHLRRKCCACKEIFNVYREGDPIHVSRYGPSQPNYVYWQEDPFGADVHNDWTKMWLCGACAYDSAMEV